MLEHEKILHDRAFAWVFDWKCTIFAKICLFSKARLHRALKDRASSMLEHQKLTSDGHFSGLSMLGCNTRNDHYLFGLWQVGGMLLGTTFLSFIHSMVGLSPQEQFHGLEWRWRPWIAFKGNKAVGWSALSRLSLRCNHSRLSSPEKARGWIEIKPQWLKSSFTRSESTANT